MILDSYINSFWPVPSMKQTYLIGHWFVRDTDVRKSLPTPSGVSTSCHCKLTLSSHGWNKCSCCVPWSHSNLYQNKNSVGLDSNIINNNCPLWIIAMYLPHHLFFGRCHHCHLHKKKVTSHHTQHPIIYKEDPCLSYYRFHSRFLIINLLTLSHCSAACML